MSARNDHPHLTAAILMFTLGFLAVVSPLCAQSQALPAALHTSQSVVPQARFPVVSLTNKMVWAHSMMSYPLDLTAVLPYFPKEVGYEAYGAKYPLYQAIDLEKRTKRNYVEADLKLAKQAGIDGFSVDIFTGEAEYYLKAADAVGGIVIAPCLDLSNIAPDHKEAVAIETIIRNCEIAKRYKSAAKVGDAVLFFTYGTDQLPTDAWQRVRDAIANAGCKTYWMVAIDTDVVNPKVFPGKAVEDLLKPFESGYLFGNPGNDQQTANRWRSIQQVTKTLNKPFGGGMMPGYFRTGAGYMDALGTSLYRDLWKLHLREHPNWVCISTWNDYQEATSIGPSSELSFTRSEITRWFSAKFKGEPVGWGNAHLYITTPQTIYPHQKYLVEGLALNPTQKTLQISVQLIDANRKAIGQAQHAVAVPGQDAAATLSLAVNIIPPGHFLRAWAILKDGNKVVSRVLSAPILILDPIAQPGFKNTIYYSLPAHAALPGTVTLHLDGVPDTLPVKSYVVLPPATKVNSVEILQNLALARNFFNYPPYETLLPRRDNTGAIPGGSSWGFYLARVADNQYRIGYSDPIYVAPPANIATKLQINFDAANQTFAPDASVYQGRMRMENVTLVDDGKGGKAASFRPDQVADNANAPTNLEPYITPDTPLVISMRVRPRAYGGMFYADSGGLWLATTAEGKLDFTRLKPGGGWNTVWGHTVVPLNHWSEIKATWDGMMSRIYLNGILEGETAAPPAFSSGKRALGYNPYDATGRYDGDLDDVLIKALPQ